jgi:phage terminase small subunit
MAVLTAKQQRFVDAYLIDANATKAAIAAGYSQKTAPEQGSRLLKNVKVASALEKRRVKASAKADLTLEKHLASLNTLRNKAAKAEQFSAAVSAEVSRGKASGFYVDKTETKHTGKVEISVRFAHEGRRVTAS